MRLRGRTFVSGAKALSTCAVLSVILAACLGSKEVDRPLDERFGHRFEEQGPEGRRTLAILPADSAASYFYYPAVIDTVHVRPAPLGSNLTAQQSVPVEILVKGSMPDGCTQMHDVVQERFGHIIHVSVQMRRPQGSVCTRVVRPYRFYLRLEGTYGEGSYTLKLNNRVFPFAVRTPQAG